MQIGGDNLRPGVVKFLKIRDNAAKGGVRLLRFQITNVLADENLVANGERDGVFQMRTNGQNGVRSSEFGVRSFVGASALASRIPHSTICTPQLDGQRRVAAGAAQDQFAVEHDTHNRIVHMPDNGTIMDEKNVGDAAQPFQGFAFVGANRFVAQVAAGRHDRKSEFGHQQMMQRRVGQHRAEVRIAGGNRS